MPRSGRWRNLLLLALPFVTALLVYADTLDAEFVYDDRSLVLENAWVKELRYLSRAVTQPVWAFKQTRPAPYYRPVQTGLYNVLWALGDGKPWVFHALNVLLHASNTLLLALLVRRLSRDDTLAFASALVFSVHPITTEAVAWVACLSELTFGLFSLLTLLLHTAAWNAPARRRRAFAIASGVAFTLALLSKETAVSLVGLVFVLEWTVRRSDEGGPRVDAASLVGAIARCVPYLLVTAGYMGVRLAVLGGLAPQAGGGRPLPDVLLNAPVLFIAYIRAILVPVRLVARHVFDPLSSVLEPAFAVGIAGVVAMIGTLVWLFPRRPDLGFAGTLLVLPLLPALYLPATGGAAFAERYAYLPAAALVWLVLGLTGHVVRRRVGGLATRRAVVVAALVLASASAVRTVARNAEWHDNGRLAESTIRDEPRAELGHLMLGNRYLEQLQPEQALSTLRNGLRNVPGSTALEANEIGVSLDLRRIELASAIARLRGLADRDPSEVRVWFGLGYAYLQAGRLDDADGAFRRSLELLPVADAALLGRALIAAKRGDDRAAVDYCRRALAINPGSASAQAQLGVSLLRLGDGSGGTRALERASSLRPRDPEIRLRLGTAYFNTGRRADARRAWEEALLLDPTFDRAREHLRRLDEPQ